MTQPLGPEMVGRRGKHQAQFRQSKRSRGGRGSGVTAVGSVRGEGRSSWRSRGRFGVQRAENSGRGTRPTAMMRRYALRSRRSAWVGSRDRAGVRTLPGGAIARAGQWSVTRASSRRPALE